MKAVDVVLCVEVCGAVGCFDMFVVARSTLPCLSAISAM
jgi:hypothetical protein